MMKTRRLLLAECAVAEGDQEDRALAPGVGREEVDHVIVVKSQAAGAEALGIGGKVEFAAQNAGFQLRGTVSAVPVALQNLLQVGEEEHIDGCIGGNLLVESQEASIVAEVPGLQQFENFPFPMTDIGSGVEAIHVIHDQIKIIEVTSDGFKKVRGNSTRGAIEDECKLRQRDGLARELASGTAARDHLFDRVSWNGIVGQLQ